MLLFNVVHDVDVDGDVDDDDDDGEDEDEDEDEDGDDDGAEERKRMILMWRRKKSMIMRLRRMMLRRKTDPKRHFIRAILCGNVRKMPYNPETTSIEHRALTVYRKNPSVWLHYLGNDILVNASDPFSSSPSRDQCEHAFGTK